MVELDMAGLARRVDPSQPNKGILKIAHLGLFEAKHLIHLRVRDGEAIRSDAFLTWNEPLEAAGLSE